MKAAFTRAYNKEVHLTPYSLQAVKKGRRGGGGADLDGGDEGPDDQESGDEAEGLKADAMIKVSVFRPEEDFLFCFLVIHLFGFSLQQKKTKTTKESTKEKKQESGKGKGKGKGKAKK